jgi:HK97 family phage portal protein
MTAYDFRECQVAHLNLRGNAYALKQENGRGIKSLIPLSPDRMNVVRDAGALVYEYTHEDSRKETFSAERIWHLKNMPISCSFNGQVPEGVLGISPIAAAKEAIGLSLAADQYGGRYFANNAVPGLNLQFPAKLTDNARAFLKESLEKYAQMENKFKSIITEEGGKIEQIGIGNKDSQFLESRQFQIEEIARIFRVYPILIGHPTNTMTYASAEQLFLAFGKFTILPICKRIEQSANQSLLTEEDRKKFFFEHNLDGLLRADTATRYTVYSQARQWGIMNVDEIRALENMNPLPDKKGQIYLEPTNMKEAGTKPDLSVPPKPGNGKTAWEGDEIDEGASQTKQ